MKLAILGTRGIPNRYGGFEQFAEYLSKFLVGKGHDVTVYSSHSHPCREAEWNGVRLRHCYNPEDVLGTAGQFIYDLNCILDARQQHYDLILQLGYSSNSVWRKWLPRDAVIITNMDGLEWKRTKYSRPVRSFLKLAERFAVESSDYLVADSVPIREHLLRSYSVQAEHIPYGAELFETPDELSLKPFGLKPFGYDLLIARLEPENSIECILEGVAASLSRRPFLVVGNHGGKFGSYLKRKFRNIDRIRFVGSIYDLEILDNLRYFSQCYFHGHTVGGTNPSLLEAMASNAQICAHNNIFNRAVLGDDAGYFENPATVTSFLDKADKRGGAATEMIARNRTKISEMYNRDAVNAAYERLMLFSLGRLRASLKQSTAFNDARKATA